MVTTMMKTNTTVTMMVNKLLHPDQWTVDIINNLKNIVISQINNKVCSHTCNYHYNFTSVSLPYHAN